MMLSSTKIAEPCTKLLPSCVPVCYIPFMGISTIYILTFMGILYDWINNWMYNWVQKDDTTWIIFYAVFLAVYGIIAFIGLLSMVYEESWLRKIPTWLYIVVYIPGFLVFWYIWTLIASAYS